MALKAGRVGVNPKGVNKEGMPILDPSVMNAAITAAVNHLAGMITVTAKTGNPIEITDAIGGAAQTMKVTLSPIQAGSGDPSPTNVREITGHSGVTVARTAGGSTVNFSVTFTDPATVFGGVLDMNTGLLTITDASVDLSGLTWIAADIGFYTTDLSTVILKPASDSQIIAGIAEKYKSTNRATITDTTIGTNLIASSNAGNVLVSSSNEPTGALVYKVATPTVVQLPIEVVQLLNGINTLASGSGTSMNISYLAITENPVTPTRSLPASDQRSVKSIEEIKEEVPVEEPVTVKKSTKKSTK